MQHFGDLAVVALALIALPLALLLGHGEKDPAEG
jgi:hypothetical protein